MDPDFEQSLAADLARLEADLMPILRSIVAECRERRADIHKGMLLVDIKVYSGELASGFPVRVTLLDAEMTPLDEPRLLLAGAGPTFPAARLESPEQRASACERLRGWLSQRWDAAGGTAPAALASSEDEGGTWGLEKVCGSFKTGKSIPGEG